ncbi:hypothetical protein Pcinc_037543 [Petrolisthes cinctipes]|uniref:Uncharacterized protein n=1 Tax=Petrolisthes cinctipes TaxID=88211 RepID=A0AAE1BTT3_PETCI|nr:hypothetical protein Pcinc_037543 [Petrolisthes cinctipes]
MMRQDKDDTLGQHHIPTQPVYWFERERTTTTTLLLILHPPAMIQYYYYCCARHTHTHTHWNLITAW